MYHIYTLKRLTLFEVDLQKKQVAKKGGGGGAKMERKLKSVGRRVAI